MPTYGDALRNLRRPPVEADVYGGTVMWFPDDDEGYVLARVTGERNGRKQGTRLDTSAPVEAPEKELQKACPPSQDMVEDMAALKELNTASVLGNLRARYNRNLIYTYSGLFCVVVNPYTFGLDIYTPEVIEAYKGKLRHSMPPHVFAIADEAHRNMRANPGPHGNQSILCTGESGAGKTENTKKVMQYLAHLGSTGQKNYTRRAQILSKSEILAGAAAKFAPKLGAFGKAVARFKRKTRRKSSIAAVAATEGLIELGDLENAVLAANDVLEPFGNAKTTRNDNSSRFGKFIRMIFDQNGYLCGAQIDTYLLEKARVLQQLPTERNFHIFYQLLEGASPELRARLKLKGPTDYVYLTNTDSYDLPMHSDGAEFGVTLKALTDHFYLTDSQLDGLWNSLTAILEMGNLGKELRQDGQDQAHLTDQGEARARRVCELLGINNPGQFRDALLTPSRGTGGFAFKQSQTTVQVEYTLGAVSKGLYERMFTFLVLQINSVLGERTESNSQFVGILDIAGFEIFEKNSLEQLCINFTNEKLQQLFNTRMFKLESEEYENEGIRWNKQDFGRMLDPTIFLIEGKPRSAEPCLFGILNDASYTNREPDDSKFVELVIKELGKHPNLHGERQKSRHGPAFLFVIKHYAGDVPYDGTNWIDKNMEPRIDGIKHLLINSSIAFIQDLWNEHGRVAAKHPSSTARTTVTKLYAAQLNELMKTLTATTTHFVRCIKPNELKRPGKLMGPMVQSQLNCNGVLEGIRIAREGYPGRFEFATFVQQYRMLAPTAFKNFDSSQQQARDIVNALRANPTLYPFLQPEDAVQFGKTKIFFRVNVVGLLDEARNKVLEQVIVGLQARARGYNARHFDVPVPQTLEDVRTCQRAVRAALAMQRDPWMQLLRLVMPHVRQSIREHGYTSLTTAQSREKEEEVEACRLRSEQLTAAKELAQEAVQREQAEIKRLREVAASMAQDGKDLEMQVDHAKRSIDACLNALAEREAEAKRTHDSIEHTQQDIQDKRIELDDFRARQIESARVTQLEKQLDAERAQQRGFGDDALIQLEQQMQQVQATNTDLQGQLRQASKEREDAERAVQSLSEQRAFIAQQLDAARSTSARAVSALTPINEELTRAKEQAVKAQAQADDSSAEMRRYQTELMKIGDELEQASDELTQKQRKIAAMKDEIAALRDQPATVPMDELEQRHRELVALQQEQEEQKDTILDTITVCAKKMTELQLTVSMLQKELYEQDMDTERHQSELINRLQKQHDDLFDECSEARAQSIGEKHKQQKLRMDIADIQDRIEAERDFRLKLQQENSKLPPVQKQLPPAPRPSGEAEEFARQLASLEALVAERRSQLHTVRAERSAANEQLEAAKRLAQEREQEYYRLKEQIRAKERILRETGDEKLAEMVAEAIAKERARGTGGKITWRIVEKTTVTKRHVPAAGTHAREVKG